MKLKKCECGQELDSQFDEICDSCSDKQEKKDILHIILGVTACIVVFSLLFATCIEYENQIDSFFTGIETWSIAFYHSLSNFMQNFLFALTASFLVILGLFFAGFVLVSGSRY